MATPTFNDLNLVDDDSADLKRYVLPIVVLLLLFLATVSAVVWWNVQKNSKNQQAMAALAGAKTIEDRQKVIDLHLGTPAIAIGLLSLAEELYTKPDYAAALVTYQKFISTYPTHLLRNAANLGLAATQEAAGKPEDAIATLQTAARFTPPDAYNAAALLQLARIQQEKGNIPGAKQALEECISRFAKTNFSAQAKTELEKLPKS
jgi:TolA-binding protein